MNIEVDTVQAFPSQCTAVVTGAGAERGIGRHVARTLAARGWNLALIDIDQAATEEFAATLNDAAEGKVLGFGADVTDKAGIDATFARIDTLLPPLSAEVNLAGVPSPQTIFELDGEAWDRIIGVNAKGTLFMMQAAASRFIQTGFGGRIVNTSSITAYDGGGTFSKIGYAAAKAAVQGLTRGAARELGPHGVTVNAIVPGPIDTDIMGGRLSDNRKSDMSADIPLQRVGQPQEVAALIAFLVSEESSFINGDSINIDGGKHMV